jgi:hypothetical protein
VDDESDPDMPWQRELARRNGEDKGSQKGFQGDYNDQKGANKEPAKGRMGQGGKAATYAATWAGWGATGGNAAEMNVQENDDEQKSDLVLLIFCIFLVLMGMGLASRAFRKPLARFLRWTASLVDAGTVSARVVLEPFRAVHEQDPASVGAMPQRAGFKNSLRMRGTRRDATPARSLEGEPVTPVLKVDLGTQSSSDSTPGLVGNGAAHSTGPRDICRMFWLERLTVYELKTHCREQGLKTSGLRADLIWRIEQHRANLAVVGAMPQHGEDWQASLHELSVSLRCAFRRARGHASGMHKNCEYSCPARRLSIIFFLR